MPEFPISRALISVWDKTDVVAFAKGLADLGVALISTSGTARILGEAGLDVTDVSDVTGFPEMLDGRVKVLHPHIYGGILARRGKSDHVVQLSEHGISPIDLVVVNLYPFQETIAREDVSFDECIEQIDVGGPTLVRAAAKNHESVTVVVDPQDYRLVLDEMRNGGATTVETRRQLAAKTFAHTAAYDASISGWFTGEIGEKMPDTLTLAWRKKISMRYGENPHQDAAFYVEGAPGAPGVGSAEQLHGADLSFNNVADLDAAWIVVGEFDEPAACIIKHTNPCGTAVGATLNEAFAKARDADPDARFGGIVALNRSVDALTAFEILAQGSFYEAIIAPRFDDDALAAIKERKGWGDKIRLIITGQESWPKGHGFRIKSVGGGVLVQTEDKHRVDSNELQSVTKRSPTDEEVRDLLFAWRVVKHIKSNAIVLAKDGATIGVGGGQMNRAVATRLAVELASERAVGAVLASDAFFPFADGPEAVAKAGVTAIIQPGGSRRDEEVIECCDRHGLAMVFTGVRCFRH